MARNDFERLCSLYLRLNGFFHMVNFSLHFTPKKKKAEEIDFVGVRFPNSSEKPLTKNGDYDERFPFRDDKQLLCLMDNSKVAILLGEATMSSNATVISERVRKLKDPLRTKYVLQRFGIFDSEEIEKIADGTSNRFCMLRIMFVLSERTVPKKDFEGVEFLSYLDMSSFIQNRASHALKASGIHLLPEGLQDFVMFLQTLRFEEQPKN